MDFINYILNEESFSNRIPYKKCKINYVTEIEELPIEEVKESLNQGVVIKGDFNGKKYITLKINQKVAHLLQQVMWDLIENMKVPQRCYFQMFELYNEEGHQMILHKQEDTNYKKLYRITSKIITTTGKVFIQDDQDTCVMMFDYEY